MVLSQVLNQVSPTADYIGSVMDKITLPGAILLAIVGILPGIAQSLGVTGAFSSFFGGTSLLIMVGVCTRYSSADRDTIIDASV
jgi:preprotein translocase subunit SecY